MHFDLLVDKSVFDAKVFSSIQSWREMEADVIGVERLGCCSKNCAKDK